jgi:hypothetical protein
MIQLAFLIMPGVIVRTTADGHPQPFGMHEVPVAALAAPVHKTGFFQVGHQVSHFARHFSIRLVLPRPAGVNHRAKGKITAGASCHY